MLLGRRCLSRRLVDELHIALRNHLLTCRVSVDHGLTSTALILSAGHCRLILFDLQLLLLLFLLSLGLGLELVLLAFLEHELHDAEGRAHELVAAHED